MSLARLFAVLPLWGILVPVLAAQQQPQKEPPTAVFGASVNEVIVPITVTDDKGRFVSNLEAKDFRILDEGRPQRIQFFSHDQRQPIVVGFLIDMSNNTRVHWKTYQDAILELVWNLLPGDKRYTGYLITYSNDAELVVNTTWDSDKIADQIKKLRPGGGASLFDAIYMACTKRELVQGEPFEPRRVLIVVGDGHDNASKKSIDEVLELAQRNQTSIYAMSTQAFGFANDTQDILERITRETGGHVEYPLSSLYKDVSGYLSTPSDDGNYALTVGTGGYAAEISGAIIKAVGGIGGEVTTQYVLRYIPDVDPEARAKVFHHIKVEIPTLPNVKIHARNGYYFNAIPGVAGGGQ
jgi:Ca-activated chloride channel family protein